MSEQRLIDANALKARIQLAPNKNEETWEELYDSIIYEIDNAPTVEFCLIADIEELTPEENKKFVNLFKKGKFKFIENAVRQQGEWVDEGVNGWKCNRCGYGVERYNNTNFCPNCGADMRGEKK